MLAPRWKKVFRDLTLNKTRTLLVVLSIAVGVFAVGAVSGARVILSNDLRATYETANDGSAAIFASNLDESFVRAIARMPEIKNAEGRSGVLLRVPLDNGARSNLILFALDDFYDIEINRIRFEQGLTVPPHRQLLLERSSLALFNKQIGDTVTVELGDGKTRELTIAGTVHDITAPPVQFANFGTAFITEETYQWLGFPKNYGQVRIVVRDNPNSREHIQAVVDKIKERIEDSGRTYFGANIAQNPGRHIADEQIQAMLIILNVLGVLALFLSAFLVTNSISAVMTQHTRQIGIMKSIGGRAPQIGAQYLAMVLAFGVMSIIVAVPFGTLGAQALAGFVAGLLNFDLLTLGIPTEVLLTEILVGLIVPVAAALVPIIAGVRMTVREAITSTGIYAGAPNPRAAERVHMTWLPRPLLLSIRNTFRRKGRLTLTLGTLVLASAIFISVFSVRDALNRSLEQSLGYWNYDIEVNLKSPHGEDKVLREILNITGVTHAEAWSQSAARRLRDDRSEGRVAAVVAPDMPTELLRPVLMRGRWLTPDDTNAVVVNADFLADESDIGIGDTITLRFGERNRQFIVVGEVQSTLTGQVRNPRVVYITKHGLREALTLGRQVSNVVVVTSAHTPEYRLQVAREIESHFRSVNMPVDTTETMSERRDQIAFQFNLLITFLLIMAALLAVVGGLGLAGTMSINVFERTREIGIMRAIGGGNRAIRMIVIVEGIVIGLLSWSAGALLAAPISYALNIAVGNAFLRRPLPFAYSWEGAGIWLLTVIIVGAVASFLPAYRASQLTVREVLAYE